MQEKKYVIKNWAYDDRPREKLLGKSPSALSNAELLAILFRCGTNEKSAVDLAGEILELAKHDLIELSRIPPEELMRIKGIGKVKAATIQACLELGRRRHASFPKKVLPISRSLDAVNYLQAHFSHYARELFVVLFLNQANNVKGFSVISTGGITSTTVDIRVILKKALEMDAVKLVLCHNHPSGSLKPSEADKCLTNRISQASQQLDIKVLDHLIISDQGYLSFADEGLL